uniref:Uncharacterized protein n=1 Tax=Arion vulgaris TaxID=1028688 RepID=A0A0B7AX63_9EUPU
MPKFTAGECGRRRRWISECRQERRKSKMTWRKTVEKKLKEMNHSTEDDQKQSRWCT